jgi:hypothetical protein
LVQGILEVEGSETFVKAIYRDFKVQFLGEDAVEEEIKPTRRRRSRKTKPQKTASVQPVVATEVAPKTEGVEAAPTVAPGNKTPQPIQPAYDFLKDLDLAASDDHVSLVEFMDSKFPITNEERNLVFLYYLQHVIKEKPITPDHVYTCYRKAKIRAPLDIEHSLRMTADHQKWIKIAKNGNITVTAAGKNYLEKQLPKKMKS